MLNDNAQRFGKLIRIAELKADRALRELADVIADRERVRLKIAEIDDEVSRALDDAPDPISPTSGFALRGNETRAS